MRYVQYGDKVIAIEKISYLNILDDGWNDKIMLFGDGGFLGTIDLGYKDRLFRDLKVEVAP